MRVVKRLRIVRTFKIRTNKKLNPIVYNNKVIRFLKKLLSFRIGVNNYKLDNGNIIQEKYISIVIFRYQIQLIHK